MRCPSSQVVALSARLTLNVTTCEFAIRRTLCPTYVECDDLRVTNEGRIYHSHTSHELS